MTKHSKILFWLKQWTRLLALVFLTLIANGQANANEIQWRICNAALGLGQAEARIALFGQAMNGAIPIDQRVEILTNLSNAAAEMTAAEALMSGPIATDRASKGTLPKVVNRIDRYASATANWPFRRQASYVANIFGMYKQGLEVTYESSRSDALRYNANCDTFVALACYNFGRATIASTIDQNFANSYQTKTNGEFRNAVYTGLTLAMDRAIPPTDPGHSPWDGHAKKICCTMGTPLQWQTMGLDSFSSSMPLAVYAQREVILRGIIGAASNLDPVCASSGEKCASSASSASSVSDECKPNTGDIRTGHYTNNLGDSAHIESLGDGNYKISAWHGKENEPTKTDWYNSGKGKMQNGLIHSTQPAVEEHPFQEYEFEGYWKIICPGKIKLEKHRNYLKGQKPNNDVGWKKEGIIYNIVN